MPGKQATASYPIRPLLLDDETSQARTTTKLLITGKVAQASPRNPLGLF
jgi:hypothetical protein